MGFCETCGRYYNIEDEGWCPICEPTKNTNEDEGKQSVHKQKFQDEENAEGSYRQR